MMETTLAISASVLPGAFTRTTAGARVSMASLSTVGSC